MKISINQLLVALLISMVFFSCSTGKYMQSTGGDGFGKIKHAAPMDNSVFIDDVEVESVDAYVSNEAVSVAEPENVTPLEEAREALKEEVGEEQFYAMETAAQDYYNSLDKVEQKKLKKRVRGAVVKESLKRIFVKNPQLNKAGGVTDLPRWALLVLTILLPPLGVGLTFGKHTYTWVSIPLTILGYLPGLIFGLVVVIRELW